MVHIGVSVNWASYLGSLYEESVCMGFTFSALILDTPIYSGPSSPANPPTKQLYGPELPKALD